MSSSAHVPAIGVQLLAAWPTCHNPPERLDLEAERKGMPIRLGRWLMWSVVFSLVPFVAVGLIRRIDSGAFPSMAVLFGSGQLMLTSVALLGNGVRELVSINNKYIVHEFLTWAATIFLFVIAASYGYTVKDVLISKQSAEENSVAIVSFVFLGISLLVAATSIAVTTPNSNPKGQSKP